MNFLLFVRQNAAFLAVGVLLALLSSFGQTYFISVFAGKIQSEFGLSHGAWGAIYAAGTLTSAIAMIWSGALTDRFRVRSLSRIVLVGLSVACVSMAVVPSVWLLPVAIFLLRLFGQGMSSHLAMVAIARWFVATRGRALSIASSGFAMGEAFLPLTFVALMTFTDWRLLWGITALVPIAVLPLILRLLRLERTPQSISEIENSAGMLGQHWTRAQAMRHWLFWVMVPSVLGPSAFGTAFFFLQVNFAEVKGWQHLELVALFPALTLAAVTGMFGSGWLIDRFGTGRLVGIAQLPAAAGFLVLAMAGSLPTTTIGMMLMGFSFGANTTLSSAFWAEFYGTRHLGGIRALATSVMVLGSAIGPALTGGLIDLGIPFPQQMYGISVWFVLVSVMVSICVARARRMLSAAPEIDVIRP